MIRILLVAILLLVIARSFWRTIDGIIEGAGGGQRVRSRQGRPITKLVRDPICGTYVVPHEQLSVTTGARIHYFCSETCRSKFRASA